jgi:hypothetical protein
VTSLIQWIGNDTDSVNTFSAYSIASIKVIQITRKIKREVLLTKLVNNKQKSRHVIDETAITWPRHAVCENRGKDHFNESEYQPHSHTGQSSASPVWHTPRKEMPVRLFCCVCIIYCVYITWGNEEWEIYWHTASYQINWWNEVRIPMGRCMAEIGYVCREVLRVSHVTCT